VTDEELIRRRELLAGLEDGYGRGLVRGWAAWSLGWFRARSDPIRAMGLRRVAFLPPQDDQSFAYLTVEARRPDRVYQANRAIGPHDLNETNFPPIWHLQRMLESAVAEIRREQNRLVVSRATMTFETTEGPETVAFGPEIADLSGTIEGTIDFVDPGAIERIMEEEARRIHQRSPGGSAGLP
jgi:hypothetical protein